MNEETIRCQARNEIQKLKEFATAEELSKLNFNTLNPHFTGTCIYGQMTGGCFSERAKELIEKCAEGMAVIGFMTESPKIAKCKPRQGSYSNEAGFFTNLEWWIASRPEKNKEIIAYLKSEQDELVL